MQGARRSLIAMLCAIGIAATSQPAFAQDDGWTLDPDARIELGAVSAESTTRDEQLVIDGEIQG